MSHMSTEGCRHDRAPLRRMGKAVHPRAHRTDYVLLCTECGFTVTTDQLRRMRRENGEHVHAVAVGGHSPGYYANLTG
jgi:hypothetical protein